MSEQQQRSGLQAWSQFLADKPLPVKSRTIQRLKTELSQPNNSLQKLSSIISTDPAFTLHLIRKANELSSNSENEANSVDLGVSILGMDHITALIDDVPIIKMNLNSVPHRWYYRSLDTSLHAAFQAADFCTFPNAKVVADTKLAALFYDVGHWALWRYAPIEMSTIKEIVVRHKKQPKQAEKHVLGCTIQEISAFLIEHWSLSQLAMEALQQNIVPNEKTLTHLQTFSSSPNALSEDQQKSMRHLMSSKYYPVKLANWFTNSVQFDWYCESTLQIQQCIADLLKTDIDQSRLCLLQNCIAVSRLTQTQGLLTPAAHLLMLASNQHIPYEMSNTKTESADKPNTVAKDNQTQAPSTQKTTAKNPADSIQEQKNTDTQTAKAPKPSHMPAHLVNDVFKDKNRFQQACQKLMAQENGCASEKEVYKTLINGLQETLGFQRICLLKVDNGVVSPTALAGFSQHDPMRRFTQKLTVPGLINKISKKTSAILMNAENRLPLKSKMSERFKACSHQNSFALMSVLHDGSPILVIYADHGDHPVEVSDFFFKYYKAIGNAASQRLNQLAESS